MAVNRKHVGGKFDDFLKFDGIYDCMMELVAKQKSAILFGTDIPKAHFSRSANKKIKPRRA